MALRSRLHAQPLVLPPHGGGHSNTPFRIAVWEISPLSIMFLLRASLVSPAWSCLRRRPHTARTLTPSPEMHTHGLESLRCEDEAKSLGALWRTSLCFVHSLRLSRRVVRSISLLDFVAPCIAWGVVFLCAAHICVLARYLDSNVSSMHISTWIQLSFVRSRG